MGRSVFAGSRPPCVLHPLTHPLTAYYNAGSAALVLVMCDVGVNTRGVCPPSGEDVREAKVGRRGDGGGSRGSCLSRRAAVPLLMLCSANGNVSFLCGESATGCRTVASVSSERTDSRRVPGSLLE